jgi:hypothetical protein
LAVYQNNATNLLTLNSSGNLGLGETPRAWAAQWKTLQIGQGHTALVGRSDAIATYYGSNWLYDGADKYIANGFASIYSQQSGQHSWFNAPSGTAGNAISFTQAMTLDASGNLLVGRTTSDGYRFAVLGSTQITSGIQMTYATVGAGAITITSGGAMAFGLDNATGSTERARINSTGELVVASGGAWATSLGNLQLSFNGDTGYITTYYDDHNVVIGSGVSQKNRIRIAGTGDDNNITFFVANAERARITSGGDLLVAKTAASDSTLGVEIQAAGTVVSTRSGSTNSQSTLIVYSTGASAYRFYVGMDGTVNATNTTISAVSDQRLKENIQDLDVGLNKIMALKPRKFDWKAGKGKDIKGDRGWIAQEFEQVFPDMIDTWKDPAPEGEEPYKSVRADLIPVLVKAIQELTARVAQLESK